MFAGVSRWDLVVMFALLAAIFVFEMLGVFSPSMITITHIIKALLPIPCRVMVLTWLTWHLFVSDVVRVVMTAEPS